MVRLFLLKVRAFAYPRQSLKDLQNFKPYTRVPKMAKKIHKR
jgi:hypothetical protein